MATSKTLAPTNVTISIPAMTDSPDQSVNSNCIDKLGDAVNALNSHITLAKAVSGSTDAEFVANLASAVNQQISLSALNVGTTLLGSAEWTGKTFCQFMMTKIGSNACNVHVTNGVSKDIIARFNINNLNVTSVGDSFNGVKYFGVGNGSTTTFPVVTGSVIFIARGAVNYAATYFVDPSGALTIIGGAAASYISVTLNDGIVTVQNTGSVTVGCTVLSPIPG